MKVTVARSSGFCRGVRAAVDCAMSVDPENTYVLGELIHNPLVTKEVEARGIRTVRSVEEVPDGARVILRSHGESRAVHERCREKNLTVYDCTCTFVKRTRDICEKAVKSGRTVVIVGEKSHPEVEGLVGWCEGHAVVIGRDGICDYASLRGKEITAVAQTTCPPAAFDLVVKNLVKECEKTLEIFKTICYTTIERQKEAESLSKTCDAVLVIGGLGSSNTNRLYEICRRNCGHVIRLADAESFSFGEIKNYKNVGMVSGASTPDTQMQEVLFKMENNTEAEVTETTETTESAVVEETVATEETVAEETVAEETPAAPAAESEEVMDMEQVLAKMDEKPKYKKGQIISAIVSYASDEGVYVLPSNHKKEILLPKDEIDCETYNKDEYNAKAGEEIEVMIVSPSPVTVSQKLIAKVREEEAKIDQITSGEEFDIQCTGFNKGGLTGSMGTYMVFVPAKEIRMGYVKELDKYVGKKLRLKALEIKRSDRKKEIIASQRVILEEEKAAREAAKAEKEAAFFANVAVGDIVEGRVERTTNFGAFVSVNGFDCLAHISDLSWSGVKNVTDVLEVGKTYQFKVLKVDEANKKVSIGYKQLQPQPWELVSQKYAEGDIVHGKVVRIVPFGAFVEVEKGVDGLVHVSQISHEWLEDPVSALSIGEEIDAKILVLDPAAKKMTLSIKALLPEPEVTRVRSRSRDNGGEGERSEGRREGGRGERRRGGNRNRSFRESDEEEEVRGWNESSQSGATISDLLKNRNND